MHSLDTLEVAKQEGRAPWTDVQLETKDFVVYNDGFPVTPGHTLVVPRKSNMQNLLRCFNYAMQMAKAGRDDEYRNEDDGGTETGGVMKERF